MGRYEARTWPSSMEPGLPRRARGGCRYRVYLPDRLSEVSFPLPAEVAADVAEAEVALAALNDARPDLVGVEALARFLLRAEAVGSSKIEGLRVSPHRLARAESIQALGGDPGDQTAREVLANIEAMTLAIDDVARRASLDASAVTDIHATLLRASATPEVAGALRDQQHWIGGNDYNPRDAEFVPPPPELVAGLVDDLVAYLAEDRHSPVVQAALAHAQFETIHPFADGNGRTGRALIHVVLRRRGLTPRIVPPVSMVLATWADRYVAGLTGCRHDLPPSAPEAGARIARWIELFAAACVRACRDVEWVVSRLDQVESRWRERVGPVRAQSSVDRLLARLPGTPVVTVASAARLLGVSFESANVAIRRLVDADVLTQRSAGRRNRVFEASDVLAALGDVERRFASMTGDTRRSPPNRPAPARR